ncbi:hypothetical protein [Pseudomonas gozinkensis]|uniref:hypothetical protein n=1 Tax=Pseudomonas gozinkensis TaxID=2774461 RepID=UPI001787FA6E|nr:hypothetical protein [Pseudomonas gozinkensis]
MNSKSFQAPAGAGQIDPTFGTNGLFIPNVPHPTDQHISVRAMTLDEDGSVYCVGTVLLAGGRSEYVCFHLSRGGVMDPLFGTDGYVRGSFDTSGDNVTHSGGEHVLIQNVNGVQKILLVGTLISGSKFKRALVRLEKDGGIDLSYGKDGVAVIDLPTLEKGADIPPLPDAKRTGNQNGAPVILLPDNKVLLVKDAMTGWGIKQPSYIVRLNADGSLDTTFNETGYISFFIEDANEIFLTSVALTDDGNYIAVGYALYSHIPGEALFVQVDENGQLDHSFNGSGYLTIGELPATQFYLDQLTLQPNKRILGMGVATDEKNAGLLISREQDGSPNIQFNHARPLLTPLENNGIGWLFGKTQPDGHVLVAGAAFANNVVIARVLNEGKLDTSLGQGTGYLRFAEARTNGTLAVAFEDKSFLFTAWFTTPTGEKFGIARGLLI